MLREQDAKVMPCHLVGSRPRGVEKQEHTRISARLKSRSAVRRLLVACGEELLI